MVILPTRVTVDSVRSADRKNLKIIFKCFVYECVSSVIDWTHF
jgi:hypothetical protein